MSGYLVLIVVLSIVTAGCATWEHAPLTVTTSCSHEQAWDASLAGMDDFELRDADKARGVLATEWATVSSMNTTGVFGREVNLARARFFLNVEPDGQTTTIAIRQLRESFSPMGVQSQSTRWKRMSPVAEDDQRVVQQLSNQLKDRGCAILH